jgi:ABC-type Fe3+-hydroxamate transport system substrate-binding protein
VVTCRARAYVVRGESETDHAVCLFVSPETCPAPPSGTMGGVRRLGLLAGTALIAIVLTGCGVKSEPTGTATAFPSHAVDAAGQTVTLAAPPLRIVSFDAGATAILHDLGLGAETVTATAASLAGEAANPSTALVIVPATLEPALLQALTKKTTAPIYHYGADPLTSAPATITQLGLVVGKGPAAATIATLVAAGLATLAAQLATEPPVRVLLEGRGFTAYGPSTPAGLAVAAAGGTNVVTVDQPLNLTAAVALDVAAWVSLQPGGSTLASLQGYPELAAVPAVNDSRIVPLPLAGFPIDAALPGALQALADDLHSAPVAAG